MLQRRSAKARPTERPSPVLAVPQPIIGGGQCVSLDCVAPTRCKFSRGRPDLTKPLLILKTEQGD